jgi:hypothetical protein
MRLGDLLIGKGVVTPAQVEIAVQRQRSEGGRLGNHLVATGALTVEQLLGTLRSQQEVETVLRLCRHTLERSERSYGAHHDNTHRARYNLARALLAAGYAIEAVSFAEAALEGHRGTLVRNDPRTRDAEQLVDQVRQAAARAEQGAMDSEPAALPIPA